MRLDSFNYWDLINLPVFIGKSFKNHYMKNNGIKEIFFFELKAEKDILMEIIIIWIFFNSIIQNSNGILIKFQIMELKKIRMITIKMSF